MAKKKKGYHTEYIIRFDEKMPNGYWQNNKEEILRWLVSFSINEKELHDEAKEKFLAKMASENRHVKVISATYC